MKTNHEKIEEEARKIFKPIEDKICKLLDFLSNKMNKIENKRIRNWLNNGKRF